jgi:hypothetical protein
MVTYEKTMVCTGYKRGLTPFIADFWLAVRELLFDRDWLCQYDDAFIRRNVC